MLTIQQATLNDLDYLVPLFDAYRQFYGRNPDMDAVRAFLLARFEHGESVLFLARLNEEPAGFAQLYPSFSSVSLARTFILNDLFVAHEARRMGVATELLNAAAEYGVRLGAVRLTLSTAITNEGAQATYQAVGWKRDEQFYVYHRTLPVPAT